MKLTHLAADQLSERLADPLEVWSFLYGPQFGLTSHDFREPTCDTRQLGVPVFDMRGGVMPAAQGCRDPYQGPEFEAAVRRLQETRGVTESAEEIAQRLRALDFMAEQRLAPYIDRESR